MEFIVLVALHLIGELYLQMLCYLCKRKKEEGSQWSDVQLYNNNLPIYSLIYTAPFLILFFMIDWVMALISVVAIGLCYFFIKLLLGGLYKKAKKSLVFILSQVLHIAVLVILYQFMNFKIDLYPYFEIIGIVFVSLLVIIPVAIFINMIKADIFNEELTLEIFNANSIIGFFERILVLIFAWFDSFVAIAIIIVTKIFVRYSDLKDEDFRNKYLLETFISIVIVLLAFVIWRYIY